MTKQSKYSQLSEQYQQNREQSPKALDDQILAAAKKQADKNKESGAGFNWKPSNWMSGAAFACVCLVGIMFIFDTDTRQLTDDIEFDYSQNSVEKASTPTFYDIDATDSDVQLEEVIVTANKREEAVMDAEVAIQDFSKVSPLAQKQMGGREGETRDRRAMKAEWERKKEEVVTAELATDTLENSFEYDPSGYPLAIPGMALEEVVVLNESVQAGKFPVLIDLAKLIPHLILDIRYFGSNNFVGSPVDGYFAAKALMVEEAATALASAQNTALARGFSLKVFDAYRPQRAVNHFVRWAADLNDLKTKSEYYPNVDKGELFAKGYIAEKSGHSRASTVDLTLVDLETEQELDMGSPFDFFDPVSWPSSQIVSEQAQQNRQLLRKIMLDHGFKPYEAEWWHFTLENEPYPDQYFDVPVE